MSEKPAFNLSLKRKLILMMAFLTLILISSTLLLYSYAEKILIREIERQTIELTKAIQIGVEEVTTLGETDEARLAKYLKELNAKGIKEISIISNADEIVASSNPLKIGEPIAHKKKELIIKAELGDPVSEEGRTYNVIMPIIAGDTQYGYIHLQVNKDDFTEIIKMNTFKRIAATIIVFFIGIIMAFILSEHYAKPIQKAVEAAKRVAAGDLNQTLNVKNRDEIGELSESFNYMISKLRENRIIEERLREAEYLSGLGQLSRSIAHEIRNPLNFINLSIGHISEKYRPDETDKQKKFDNLIDGMKQEIQRLNKLINDFLDYGKPLRLDKQRIRVEYIVEDILSLVWAKAEAEGITIIKEFSAETEVSADPDLLKSCILNIISNAFHAMENTQEKILRIKTYLSNDNFILSITDSGIGVAEEDISKIFEPFFSTRQSGLGLGLPMTQRVIEEHSGKVEFNSTLGRGSEVKLILPVK